MKSKRTTEVSGIHPVRIMNVKQQTFTAINAVVVEIFQSTNQPTVLAILCVAVLVENIREGVIILT